MERIRLLLPALAVMCAFAIQPAPAQTAKPKPNSKTLPVVFAVLNDGKVVEPIGYVDKESSLLRSTARPKLPSSQRSIGSITNRPRRIDLFSAEPMPAPSR